MNHCPCFMLTTLPYGKQYDHHRQSDKVAAATLKRLEKYPHTTSMSLSDCLKAIIVHKTVQYIDFISQCTQRRPYMDEARSEFQSNHQHVGSFP